MLDIEFGGAEPSDEEICVAAEAAIARRTPENQVHRGPFIVELPGDEAVTAAVAPTSSSRRAGPSPLSEPASAAAAARTSPSWAHLGPH